jgi:dephospho-CoA kinase
MKVIGITGGVGSGKSEILQYLQEQYQAFIIKADEVGHLALAKEGRCYNQIVDLLGEEVLADDGELNRHQIAAKVFARPELLDGLNNIVHPFVKSYIKVKIALKHQQNSRYFFIEAALLLEDNYEQICDEIWYIYVAKELRYQRLKDSRHYSDEKITQIMNNQLSEDEFRRHCDWTIDNSGTLGETIKQIELRMQEYENV